MNRANYCRVWGYATASGDMALTTDPKKGREWSQMFRERGEPCVAEFRLIAKDKKGRDEIRSNRAHRRTKEEA